MKRRNLIIVACFLVYIAIVILPPLIYHYVYPNNNDDTIGHLNNILANGLHNPFKANFIYAGYIYIGYPLLALSHFIHVSFYSVWVWFNLLIMLPVGFVLYFIGSKLVNWQTGLLMLLIPTVVAGGLMNYQDTGIIFSMIEVAMLMPLLIYLCVRYWAEKRVYQLILIVLLTIIASTFHTSGIYVPMIVMISLVAYLIYMVVKKDFGNVKKALILSATILVVSCISIVLVAPQTLSLVYKLGDVLFSKAVVTSGVIQITTTRTYSMPIWYWLVSFVSIAVVVLVITAFYVIIKERVKFNQSTKMYLYLGMCWIVPMLVMGFGRLTVDPIRSEMDSAIIVAIFGALLFGSVFMLIKDKTLLMMLAVVVVASSGQTLRLHFQDNSAVKLSDKEAINYINTLHYSNYTCSSNVAYWVYDQLVNAKYSENADLIITRSKPMTPRSDKVDSTYISHDYVITAQDVLLKSFANNGIEVDIYEKR